MQGKFAARRAAQSGPRGVQIQRLVADCKARKRAQRRERPSDDFRVGTMRRVFLLRDEWGNERTDSSSHVARFVRVGAMFVYT